MKKLILSISLMITSVSFSQDVPDIFDMVIDCATAGDKQSAIDYFEKHAVPMLFIGKTEYHHKYKSNGVEYRISDDGIMALLPDVEKLNEAKAYMKDIFERDPIVDNNKKAKFITYTYDYMQLADTHQCKEFLEAGVKYYIFSPYVEKKEY